MRAVTLSAVLLVITFASGTTSAQSVKAGVVSALEGHVTASRTAAPEPVPLRLRDDVYLQDRITAGDRSLVRLLLGGKAVVTLRERSSVTVTERPDRSTVTLDSGRIAVAVARERMRPGEVVEVRTPNAVAAVRGTVLIAEVTRAAAQSSPSAVPVQTSFFVFGGSVEAQVLTPAGTMSAPFVLSANDMVVLVGASTAPLSVRRMTPGERARASGGLRPTEPPHAWSLDQGGVRAVVTSETTALVGALTGHRDPAGPTASGSEPAAPASTFGSASSSGSIAERGPTATSPATPGTTTNAGSRTNVGPRSGWTAAVVPPLDVAPRSGFGPLPDITPIATLRPTTVPINPCTQNQDICAPRPPCEQDPEGCATTSAAGFAVSGSLIDVSQSSVVLLQVVGEPPGAGVIVVTEGWTLTPPGVGPLVDLVEATVAASGYLLLQGAGSVVSLNGPLLRATDTTLDLAGGLVRTSGGSVLEAPDSGQPLVTLTRGSLTAGTETRSGTLFDLRGTATAADPDPDPVTGTPTGLDLGTERPLTPGSGAILEANGTAIDVRGPAGSAFKVDTALLEATAPLINLRGGASLTTSGNTVDLSLRAKVTSLGDALVKLDASALTTAGHLVDVAGGSRLGVAGDLVRLANGSTLNVGGMLLNVTGGSIVSITGALVGFSGSNNTLNLTNALVPTGVIAGIPVFSSLGGTTGFTSTTALTGLNASGNTIRINGTVIPSGLTSTSGITGSVAAIQGGGGSVTIGP
jgi:hypothetical protein